MSIKVMSRVWQCSVLKGVERLTLVALADCANDEGECYPSLTTLAKKVNCGVPRICKILTDIEKTGEIKRQRSSGGWNKRSKYRITVTENTVTGNSITGNTVAGNTVTESNSTLSRATDALNSHRTVSNSASRKKRGHADADPRVKPLVTAFADKYLARVGSPYPITWSKDAPLMKDLLGAGHDASAIEYVMDLYFASEFYSKNGFDVGRFKRAFPSLNSAGAKKRHNYDDTEGFAPL